MDSNLPASLRDELEGIGGNRDVIPKLVAQLQTPLGVIPFVGAGLSKPFGFPSWREFLLNQARNTNIEEKIDQRLVAGKFEEAAKDLLDAQRYRAFHHDIGTTFAEDKIRGDLSKGAVSFLPRLTTGPVITTNFDRVLERTFDQAGEPFERVVLGAKAEPAIQAYHQNRRFLLKIHGDVGDSEDRILTEEDYKKHYGGVDSSTIERDLSLPRLLWLMFAARPLLFIGCSLDQDRSVAVLDTVVREYRSISHYAIVGRPEAEEQFYERSGFLSDHNRRPIWYPHGQHDLIEPLLEYLVNQAQDNELHMNLDISEHGLEIYLTGSNKNWEKDHMLRYQETADGYLLTGLGENQIGWEFKHFVVCDDVNEEKDRIRDILGKADYIVTGDGKKDDDSDRWQIWFLVQDYPILRDNNVWCRS